MEIRGLTDDDLEQAWALDRESFHVPAERRELFFARVDPQQFFGAFEAGRLVAMSGIHDFGQFFGGRAVPMGGLTSVAVAAHRRGQGLGRRVVGACLGAMRERGHALSSLLPATTRVYRALGWELAGATAWRRVAPSALVGLPAPDGVAVRPGTPADEAARRACYRRMASGINGCLDRSERWWESARTCILPERTLHVVEDASGEIAGYLLHRQIDGPWGALGGPFGIACDEIVWTRREAALALWRLLASWASQVERVIFRGGPEEAALLLLPEQVFEPLAELRWMLRVIDPEAAVARRGFAEGLRLRVALEIEDPDLPEVSRAWTLCVENGAGRLEPGGNAGLRLDVGAFSSLYSGWAGTAVLARAGRLSGGRPEERAALDAAFAGPTPWLLDDF